MSNNNNTASNNDFYSNVTVKFDNDAYWKDIENGVSFKERMKKMKKGKYNACVLSDYAY